MSAVSYLKFVVVFAVYVVYVLFRRLPIAFLPQIRKEIALTNDDIGLIVSLHAAAFTISKLVFGVIADRSSNVRIYLFGLAMSSFASFCLAMSSEVSHMMFAMIFIGSMQGAGWVPATKLVGMWFPGPLYGTMFSLLGCGSTAAGLILPLLKDNEWRSTEFSMGFVFLSLSTVLFSFLYSDHHKECERIKRDRKLAQSGDGKAAETLDLIDVAQSSVIWNIAIIYFFSMEMRTICETWIPLYLNEKNVSSNGFQFLYEIGGLIGGIVSGVVVDLMSPKTGTCKARKLVGMICTCNMMLSAMAIFYFEEYASILGFITGFFVYGSINIWCLIGSQSGHSSVIGTCSAFISFVANFGSVFAGSPLANLIASQDYSVFKTLFMAQIMIVMTVSLQGVPLKMESVEEAAKKKKKKIN